MYHGLNVLPHTVVISILLEAIRLMDFGLALPGVDLHLSYDGL